jgi:hypothetical protein
MRYRLRTLLIVLATSAMLMAVARSDERQERLKALLPPLLDTKTIFTRRWVQVGPQQDFDTRQLMGQWLGHQAKPTQAEIEAAIRKSAELGAPQPKSPPRDYGELPKEK